MKRANKSKVQRSQTGATKLIWPIAALLVLLLFNLACTPGFFGLEFKDGHLYGSLVDVLNRAAPVLLVSLGMTLVIATGGVDLSVGAVMAIAGSVAALLLTRSEASLATVFLATLGLCALAGAWNGVLVAVFRIQPIVATLILMVAGRGIAQLLTDGQIITFEHRGFGFLGSGYFLGLPFTVTLVISMLAFTGALTRLTAMGWFIESVGDNETASRYAGINVPAVKLLAYAFCGLCSGVAGLIVASDIKAADANNAGLYLELDAIFAVVIGGTLLTGGRFSLLGSMVGALIMQTLTTTILTRGVPVEFTLVVKAIVVFLVCLLQSEALRRMLWQRRTAG